MMQNQEIKDRHSLTSMFHTTHRDKTKLLAYCTMISFRQANLSSLCCDHTPLLELTPIFMEPAFSQNWYVTFQVFESFRKSLSNSDFIIIMQLFEGKQIK